MRRIDLAAGFLLLLAVPSVTLVAIAGAQDKDKVTRCQNNLAQLWKMQNVYMVYYGGPKKSMPIETGGDFWLKLSQPPTVLIDSTLADLFQCPLDETKEAGTCDYRGPASDVNLFGDGDPVGADIDGNHGEGKGGNVLRKSGDVQTVAADDALWIKAAQVTTTSAPRRRRAIELATAEQIRALADLAMLLNAARLFRDVAGRWPATLDELVRRPKDLERWPEGGFVPKIPVDPWGGPYLYERRERREPRIVSLGADEAIGGTGANADLEAEFASGESWTRQLDEEAKAATLERLREIETKLGADPYPRTLDAKDGWGRPLVYRPRGDGFDLYSLGADGRPGGRGLDADFGRGVPGVPEPDPWEDWNAFPVGTWIEDANGRTTIVAKTEDRIDLSKGGPIHRKPGMCRACLTAPTWTASGSETLTIDKRKYACRIYELKACACAAKVRVWHSPEIPGGIAKSDRFTVLRAGRD